MNTDKQKLLRIAAIAALAAAALISFFVFAGLASDPENHAGTLAALDEKRSTVLQLTAASSAASSAITLIPGDAGTPIAEKLADLSGYFLFIFCVIYAEKFLVTMTGLAAFKLLIPAACALMIAGICTRRKQLDKLALKLAAFGLILFLIVPLSMKVSDIIEDSYRASINETLEAADQSTRDIEESAEESKGDEEDFMKRLLNRIKGGISGLTDKLKNVLSNFIDAIAVLMVTSCIIPILVLIFMIWITRLLLGFDIHLPSPPRRGRRVIRTIKKTVE